MPRLRSHHFALPLAAALSFPALAHDHSHDHEDKHEHSHEHGAHEHGVSRLDAVLEGNTLELALAGPAHNFVGFEHAPQTAAEKQAIAQARQQLEDGAALFGLPAAAGCTLAEADVDADHGHAHEDGAPAGQVPPAKAEAHGHDHDHAHDKPGAEPAAAAAHGHDHDHDDADGHRDYAADYRFTCTQPQALRQIDVGVFRAFSQTTEIRYQLAAPGGQTGGTLTPANSNIALP